MPLRIAFDLDGVLADMESELAQHAETLFGKPVRQTSAPAAPPEAETEPRNAPDEHVPLIKLDLSSRQQRKLWQHVASITNFWESLRELEPGVIARLSKVAIERHWEIIFLTKRPDSAGWTAQMQTQRWLESKGFKLPSVFVVQSSRGRIASALALDIVVDDRPENCLDIVMDSEARAILVWRDDEANLPAAAKRLGIGVVKSVSDCLDILVEIDTPEPAQPGLMTRVMRKLGLKETANA